MYEIDKQKFGSFLAGLRKEKGMTQRELAQALYISDKAVSKWETGQSLPDVALLKPLAELLGVTVTELLEGHHMDADPIEPERVEGLLQKAVCLADSKSERVHPKGKLLAGYVICVWITAIELVALYGLQIPFLQDLLIAVLFPLCFGAYFWLFVQARLPDYYDGNRISVWSDGPLRMNIPSVAFTNRNWPYIVKTLRIWSALTMTLYPLIHLAGSLLLPNLWTGLQLYVFLAVTLGGLFLPLVIVGRKYQ